MKSEEPQNIEKRMEETAQMKELIAKEIKSSLSKKIDSDGQSVITAIKTLLKDSDD